MFVLRVPAPVAQARPEPWGMAAEEQAQGSLIPIDHGRHQAAVIVGVEHPHAHACRTEPLDRITRTSTVVIRESSIRVTTDRVPAGDPSLSDGPLRSDQGLKPRGAARRNLLLDCYRDRTYDFGAWRALVPAIARDRLRTAPPPPSRCRPLTSSRISADALTFLAELGRVRSSPPATIRQRLAGASSL